MMHPDGRVRAALKAYLATPWGRAASSPDHAAGLCKRASLVLLVSLEREGAAEARLWFFGAPKPGRGYGTGDEHYVVVIGDTVIDATARQFDPQSATIACRPFTSVADDWECGYEVTPDSANTFFRRDPHDIPPNWRDLLDVDPPGDAIGWPYPGPWPTRGAPASS